MSKVLQTNIHWGWRYLCGQTNFSNICSIWANKNNDKLSIFNLIIMKLHKIHVRIVIMHLWSIAKNIFIGVDVNPDWQNFRIFCQFEPTKMARSRSFWIWSWKKLYRIHGRIVVNVCVKYCKQIFICVWDIIFIQTDKILKYLLNFSKPKWR